MMRVRVWVVLCGVIAPCCVLNPQPDPPRAGTSTDSGTPGTPAGTGGATAQGGSSSSGVPPIVVPGAGSASGGSPNTPVEGAQAGSMDEGEGGATMGGDSGAPLGGDPNDGPVQSLTNAGEAGQAEGGGA